MCWPDLVAGYTYIDKCWLLPPTATLSFCCPTASVCVCASIRFVQVANNRYNLFGKTNTCRVSSDDFQDRFLGA